MHKGSNKEFVAIDKAQRASSVQRVHQEIWDSPLVSNKEKYVSMFLAAQGCVSFDGETLTTEEKKAHGITSRRKVYRQEFDVFTEEGVRQNANAFFSSRFCYYMTICQIHQSLSNLKKGTDKVELRLCRKNETCPKLAEIKEGIYPIDEVRIVPCEDCKDSSYCTATYIPKF